VTWKLDEKNPIGIYQEFQRELEGEKIILEGRYLS
jgi:hypothetical protein